MRTILKTIAAIVLIGSIAFLGGEWPETATRSQVVLCDGSALLVAFACGMYLRHAEKWKARK